VTARRVDANHATIVAVLRDAGALVLSLAPMGRGCPDLLVAHHGRLFLAEVKDGSKSPSRQRLTPDEARFHALWPVTILRSVDDALRMLEGER
jgi:hypothetical protein